MEHVALGERPQLPQDEPDVLDLEHPKPLVAMLPSKPLQRCTAFGLRCCRLTAESHGSKITDAGIIDGARLSAAGTDLDWQCLTVQRRLVCGHKLRRPR